MRTKRSASSSYTSVINGQRTWGKIIYDLKIDEVNMGTEVNKMLEK